MPKVRVALICNALVLAVVLACAKKTDAPAGSPQATPAPAAAAAAKVEPYSYPPPVKGHFQEANTGDFDLVDGIAYTAKGGAGTVVYVTSKPIASPVLAASACPMTLARAVGSIRDAGWTEVTLDAAGKSKYYSAGTPFGGTGREEDVGGRYWKSSLALDGGRAKGEVRHKHKGEYTFDLPVSTPRVTEISESDKVGGKRWDPLGIKPTQEQVVAAYQALRAAALKKDLAALLEIQGFDAKQIAAIRGLEGIDADFAVYADRFLEPGTTGEFQNDSGYGAITGEGTNSKGAKFTNFYWFTPCEGKLVLTSIMENAQ